MFLYLIFISVFGLNFILSLGLVQSIVLSQDVEMMLFKRQVSPQNPSQPHKRTRRPAREIQNDKALKAAKMLLKNDNMDLSQVMEKVKLKHMPEEQSSSTISQDGAQPSSPTTKRMNELQQLINAPSSPKGPQSPSHSDSVHNVNPTSSPTQQPVVISTAQHSTHSPHSSGSNQHLSRSKLKSKLNKDPVPKPFSKDVIRRQSNKRPRGYESNANTIALSAETLLRNSHGLTHEDAIKLAKEKLAKRRERQATHLRSWNLVAATDPAKAREMKTNVPKNMIANLYIPARAHQLHHRGEARDMKECERLAKLEAEQTREKK